MSRIAFTSAALAALTGVANAASAEQWALRSVYQVMTDRYALPDGSTNKDCPELDKYCGGTWSGIANNLDYIQGMGFNAIQISPVVENIPDDTPYGEAYHGYWPVNNYALNKNFGTEDDLKHLAKTLHDKDMLLMVDVVINDMAQAIPGVMPQPIDYSVFNPFNNERFFTPYCNITDYENKTIAQNCWIGNENVALPDLDTHSDEVIKMTGDWIKELISNYSIDGLRIDAAKHISDNFLPLFIEAAGVFTFGEVYTGDTDAQCRYQQLGLVAGLPNYIEYFPMIQAFTAGNMKDLAEQKDDTRAQCNDTTVLGTFSENHDLPRWPSFVQDMTLVKNAMSFVILNDGIPIIYQGQEHFLNGSFSPNNRQNLWATGYATDAPLYNLTATLNRLRNHAISVDSRYVTEHSEKLYVDDATMCTRKGPDGVQIVACFSNQGSQGGEYELAVPGGFPAGTQVIDIFNCTRSTANSAGNITALMGQGQPKAYFPVAQMEGSGLCGYSFKQPSFGMNSSGNGTSSGSGDKGGNGGGKHNSGNEIDAKMGSILLGAIVAMGSWFL